MPKERGKRGVERRPERGRSDVLYGRNPVREALRAGRRRVHRVWADAGAAREPWLAGARVEVVAPTTVAARCGSDAHQGVVRRGRPVPRTRAPPSCSRRRAAARRARRGPGPAEPRRDRPHRRVRGARRASSCPSGARPRSPRRRRRRRGRGRAPADRARAQPRRLPRRGEGRGCWCYGADARRRALRQPDYSGGVVLVLGAEGKGLRPRVAASCDQLVALPLHGRMESLNVAPRPPSALRGGPPAVT
jgi:23S rRNA (guanosine2251-2'-O)-methyltransferase